MTPGRIPLTEASERNLAALRRSMVRTGRFALHLLIADGPARAELRARLVAVSGEGGVPVLRFFAEGRAGADQVSRWLSAMEVSPLAGAVLVDGDSLVAAEEPILALNAARDRLAQLVTGPLLIILSPRSEVELSRMAPDLFDVRTATYEIEVAGQGAPRSSPVLERLAAPSAPVRSAPPSAEALRAQEGLTMPPALLADGWLILALARNAQGDFAGAAAAAEEAMRLARGSGYRSAIGNALRIKAWTDLRRGHLDEAEQALKQALSIAGEQGDHRIAAFLWCALAAVHQTRGQLAEAVNVLRDQALPAFERAGAARERALAARGLADVLRAIGEAEEAVRILRDEALPAFERLNAAHERTGTMRQIARILQERGEVDEALRILRTEVVPASEGVGSERDLLLSHEQIAKLLLVRDHPGDRDAARDLLALAHESALRLGLPKEAAQIRSLQQRHGLHS